MKDSTISFLLCAVTSMFLTAAIVHNKQSRRENERREEQLVRYCIGYAPLQPVTAANKKRSFSF